MCVYVCVSVCDREREREREPLAVHLKIRDSNTPQRVTDAQCNSLVAFAPILFVFFFYLKYIFLKYFTHLLLSLYLFMDFSFFEHFGWKVTSSWNTHAVVQHFFHLK